MDHPRTSVTDDLLGVLKTGASGMLLGAVAAFILLGWSGAPWGFPMGTSELLAFSVLAVGGGIAGLVGGLCRPMLGSLRAQLIFSFSVTVSIIGGLGFLVGASRSRTILVVAVATPLLLLVGRASGLFQDLAEGGEALSQVREDESLPDERR